jgi:hypothetical protein
MNRSSCASSTTSDEVISRHADEAERTAIVEFIEQRQRRRVQRRATSVERGKRRWRVNRRKSGRLQFDAHAESAVTASAQATPDVVGRSVQV